MRRIVIAALLGTAAIPAEAATWIQVATATGDNPVLVDAASIKRLNGNVVVWVKFMKDGGNYSVDRDEIECREDTVRTTATESYDSTGKALDGYVYRAPVTEPIFPDSVMQATEKYVCPRSLNFAPTTKRRRRKAEPPQ